MAGEEPDGKGSDEYVVESHLSRVAQAGSTGNGSSEGPQDFWSCVRN